MGDRLYAQEAMFCRHRTGVFRNGDLVSSIERVESHG